MTQAMKWYARITDNEHEYLKDFADFPFEVRANIVCVAYSNREDLMNALRSARLLTEQHGSLLTSN